MEDELPAMRQAVADLDREEIADAIQSIGFECTDCGACCRGDDDEHVATVFPEEVRAFTEAGTDRWRDVVRPMPFGLDENETGVTLEWALQTSACGDCRFLEVAGDDSRCTRYAQRPSICRTYPFTLEPSPEAPPQGEAVEQVGPVQAHECEGLGRDIDRDQALELADELLSRAERSLAEARKVRGHLERDVRTLEETVVIDSEGYKRPDGTAVKDTEKQR